MADPTRITASRSHFRCLAAACTAAVAAAHTIGSRPVRCLALFVLLALTVSLAGLGTTHAAAKMPLVRAHGAELHTGGDRFIAYGFNYGTLEYFDRPNAKRLGAVRRDFERMRRMKVNTVRVFLELPQFMSSANRPNRRALQGLSALLRMAQAKGIYLDITGNLVWRPGRRAAWYERLEERERWQVQARFWRAVANRARSSNAVFTYELTSEPLIPTGGPVSGWYTGRFGGYDFGQYLVRDLRGRDPYQLGREWARKLSSAIRSRDRRHLIGVGLLPFASGPLGPRNLASELDLLLVHKYPKQDQAQRSVDLMQAFAAHGKPVVLGETFPLASDNRTWREFLLGSRPYLEGFLSHYFPKAKGDRPDPLAEALVGSATREFLRLRKPLLGEQHGGA